MTWPGVRAGLRRSSPYLLAALLATAGTAHLLAPEPYARIVPRQLPAPTALVYLSGVAELACAGGLLLTRTSRAAAISTAVLFVAVFPANVQMAVDATGRSPGYQTLTWARLPLQIPLIAWAVQAARAADPSSGWAGGRARPTRQ